jgi:5-methylcytosine-specific restriction endonuclease McrBC regulatory subunit McrC
MDRFFEVWVETVLRVVAQRTGAQMKVGRNRETTHPINWNPSYLGSQKSLAPDIWLEWDSATLIIDAKYKRHWEELQQHSWWRVAEEIQEQHRNDLLQVLAYANLARTSNVIVCLVYPCSAENWTSLRERGRLIYRAELAVGSRAVHIWLTAVPMATAVEQIAVPLADSVRKAIAGITSY